MFYLNEIIIALSLIGMGVTILLLIRAYLSKTATGSFGVVADVVPLLDLLDGYIAVFEDTAGLLYTNEALRNAVGDDPRSLSSLLEKSISPTTVGEQLLKKADDTEETVFWKRKPWESKTEKKRGVVLFGQTVERLSAHDNLAGDLRLDVEEKLLEKNSALLWANHSLVQSRTQLRRLVEKLYDIKDKEGIRVARELHDELGQILTGLKIEVVLLNRKIEKSDAVQPETLHLAEHTLTLIDLAILRVQKLSKELRPPMLDKLGLVATFETVMKETAKQTGIVYEMNNDISDVPLSTETLTYAYRIFKETVTSLTAQVSVRHVYIDIEKEARHIRITIGDDSGADPEMLFREGSVGILGMTEYARKIGGTFSLSGDRANGLAVHVTLPISNR